MRQRLFLVGMSLMISSGCKTPPSAEPPRATPAGAFEVPVPESFRLSNGVEVWHLASRQVPMVSLALLLRFGSTSDPPGKEGLAALTADMLDEGAGARGALEIAEEIDHLGAELGIDAQKEHLQITLGVLRRNLDAALDLLADVVLRPSFADGEWDRVKALMLNDLIQRREEPRDVARVVSERVFYGDANPYGHPLDGYEASVRSIELADVRKFYADHARPDAAIVMVAGDISADELRQKLESRLGGWKAQGAAPSPPQYPAASPEKAAPSGPRVIVVDKPEAPQTEVRVLLPGPRYAAADLGPLALANTVLGGTFTSRLVTNLRERNGFTYGASSLLVARGATGHLVAGSAVYRDKTAAALVEVCRELRAMETGRFEDEELAKSRSTHKSRLVESLETQDSILGLYSLSAALGFGPSERRDFHRRTAASTPAEIQEAARRYYAWDRSTIVLVGDKASIEAQLTEARANPPKDLAGRPCTFGPSEVLGRDGEPPSP